MTFPLVDLNVYHAPAFVTAVAEALQRNRAEFVLLHAITRNHGTYILRDYLHALAQDIARSGVRKVTDLASNMTAEQFQQTIDDCRPGDLVFFSELDARSEGGPHAVSSVGKFVRQGATVFAVIHGVDSPAALTRLEHLWAVSLSASPVEPGTVLPAPHLIAYEAVVQEVPVVRHGVA